jgi:hypothetical protein
VWAR